MRRPCGLATAISAVVALTLSGCAGGGGTGGQGARSKDTIVIGTTESLENSFDPAQAYDYLGSQVVMNSAETLVTYQPGATELTPLLAEALPEVSPDGLTYTFQLRSGVKFQDDTPLDAAAVKFSLERARDFGIADARTAGFLLTGIEDVTAAGPLTVVIRLRAPNVTFLDRLAYSVAAIVSPEAYGDHLLDGATGETVSGRYKTDTIVGTGQYRLTSYRERESLAFEANRSYWGDAPKTGRILVRLFDRSSALKLALEGGEVDVAYRALQPDEVTSFKGRQGFRVVEGDGPGIRYLVINVQSKPWDDPDLRRALAAAVDRDILTTEALKRSAKPLASMVPTSFPTSVPKWIDLYGGGGDSSTRDRLLTAAGVPPGDKVKVDLWFSPTHYGDTEATVAEVLARILEETGRFDVDVSSIEWSEYGEKRARGEMPVFLLGWYPDYLDEDNYLEPFSNPDAFNPAK
ncbi:MAG: ABC transporter substrate-binding protein, partial [Acidimicrobiia bacterium]